MKTVLFVCTGNTCRSPMAAAIANKIFQERRIRAVAASCGIYAAPDANVSENAAIAMRDMLGADISGHRARVVREEYLAQAHIVIALTASHKHGLCLAYPEFADKVYAIAEFGGEYRDINDPFGGNLEIYIETAGQMWGYFENLSWEEYI